MLVTPRGKGRRLELEEKQRKTACEGTPETKLVKTAPFPTIKASDTSHTRAR